MGYWKSEPHPMASAEHLEDGWTGDWGDQPADVLDDAIARIVEIFESDLGRKPTKAELRAGLEFSLSVHEEE